MHNRSVRAMLGGIALVALFACAASAQTPPGSAAAVPPAVLEAFRQAYPGSTVSAVSPVRDGGRPVFRVEALDKGRRRTVLYDAKGALVEATEEVQERELPAPVVAAIRAHRRAIYVSGVKVTRGKAVEYRLTLRGSRRTAMVVKPDGTVITFE